MNSSYEIWCVENLSSIVLLLRESKPPHKEIDTSHGKL